MKTSGKQRRRKDEASLKSNTTIGISSTRGKNETSLVGKDEHLLSSRTTNDVLEHGHGQTQQPSVKIKLQLFPIDEQTRLGLEKDGHNPHLELSLKAQKRIHSVVKHLNKKWGSSSIAMGELMLFPYSIQMENLSVYKRWTLKDIDTSAEDVYAVIGRPSIFRLRYGWFSNFEPKKLQLPLTSSGFEEGLQSEDKQNDFSKKVEIMEREKQRFEDETRTNKGVTLSSVACPDSLTNISIGGLLSEASLQGNTSCDPVIGNDLCLQQVPFTCDSFDAAISNLIHGRAQGPKLSSNGSFSSILDAEETCHAFPFQKMLSLGENLLPAARSAPSGCCSQDASSKSFKISNSVEVCPY
ncbi:TSL-kinase interacting protein 1 isoform X2 [Telopea speciosissima]|uniref:TSL-kinase interacting protein 1 isoform X2 n=1 Tax=Telopea speciosissima TaxID=54955 RepID=UPI001CC5B9E8|nr:TSL-kinase interacting protein 1 isoform X2 [Telopea speciosissima]